jgi:hypothetical protein
MRLLHLALLGLAVLLLAGAAGTLVARAGRDGFDHWQHRRLFPACDGCHAGIGDSARAVWPSAADCAACHDGKIQRRVDWAPPAGRRPSNLRFDHRTHAEQATRRLPADSLACSACHVPRGGGWMEVRRAAAGQCLDCHGIRAGHLATSDTACATCHLTLAQATSLPVERIARFPAPPTHRAPDFARQHEVSAGCATCHAQDFCIVCHVNAPETRAIQALAADRRSLAIEAKLEAPPDHAVPTFLERHGHDARRAPARCATCHTQESCLTCHTAQPTVATALHPAGPGRAAGAKVTRVRPISHGDDFTSRHAGLAAASSGSCTACHARADCLDCHRPDAGTTAGFHPVGFLARHPSAAYARETSCAECHNQGQFCADCHAQAGLSAKRRLRGGFHDAKPAFLLAHGPAARQSLETCVSCHTERDCLTCHSDVSGRGFNPHGPGFDAGRMRRRNSQSCTVCHGAGIPPTP